MKRARMRPASLTLAFEPNAPPPHAALRALLSQARERLGERQRAALDRSLDALRPPQPLAAQRPRPGLVTGMRPLPRIRRAEALQLRTSEGRTLSASVQPDLATWSSVEALRRASAANQRGAAQQISGLVDRSRTQAKAQRALEERVSALEERGDSALMETLSALTELQRRLATGAHAQRQALRVSERSTATQLARRELALRRDFRARLAAADMQKATEAVSSMQVAAFGRQGSLFSANNVLLGLNQLLWSYIDPLLRALGLWSGPGPSPLARYAPLGLLATGAVTIGTRQPQRFVSGVATFSPGQSTLIVPLREHMTASFFQRFRRRTSVLVVVSPSSAPSGESIEGVVTDGRLVLSRTGQRSTGGQLTTSTQVAWLIDTELGAG